MPMHSWISERTIIIFLDFGIELQRRVNHPRISVLVSHVILLHISTNESKASTCAGDFKSEKIN